MDLEKDGVTGMSRLYVPAGDNRGYAFLAACMLQALCPVVARGQPRPLGALEEIMRDTVAEGSVLSRGPSLGPFRGRRFEIWFGHLVRAMRHAAGLEEHRYMRRIVVWHCEETGGFYEIPLVDAYIRQLQWACEIACTDEGERARLGVFVVFFFFGHHPQAPH